MGSSISKKTSREVICQTVSPTCWTRQRLASCSLFLQRWGTEGTEWALSRNRSNFGTSGCDFLDVFLSPRILTSRICQSLLGWGGPLKSGDSPDLLMHGNTSVAAYKSCWIQCPLANQLPQRRVFIGPCNSDPLSNGLLPLCLFQNPSFFP